MHVGPTIPPITTKYYVAWQQEDGSWKFQLTKAAAGSSIISGTAPSQEEAVRLAKQSVCGAFARKNAERRRRGIPLIIGTKKKRSKQSKAQVDPLPLLT